MDVGILQELETIKDLLIIIMFLLFFRVLMKSLESIQVVIKGFKAASEQYFNDKIESLIEVGKLDQVAGLCSQKLKDYPNHLYANWFSGIANYYLENDDQAVKFFDRVVYLQPSWEDSTKIYVDKINARRGVNTESVASP